jgi:hypothetical protein
VTRSGKRRERSEPERQPRRRAEGLHRDFACERAVARPKPPAKKNSNSILRYHISIIFIQTVSESQFSSKIFFRKRFFETSVPKCKDTFGECLLI